MSPFVRRLAARWTALWAALWATLAVVGAVSPRLCFAEGAAPVSVASAMARWPAQGKVSYRVLFGENGVVVGRTVHQWQHDGQRFSLSSVSEAQGVAALFGAGTARQESQGRVGPDGLMPESFRSVTKKRDLAAQFDWRGGTLAMGEATSPLKAGTQDVLSMYYQLSLARSPGEVVVMPIATGRKLASYRFESVGYETLTVGDVPHAVEHVRVREDGQQFEFWVQALRADSAGSPLPLKIRVTERNGQVFEQVLEVPGAPGVSATPGTS